MQSFIWDHVWTDLGENGALEAQKSWWVDSTPLRFLDRPKSSVWLGLIKPLKNYRIHVIWAPLLNRTPPIEYSNTTPVKNLVLGQKLDKLQQNLNCTPLKNPFWKIEYRGSNNVSTVINSVQH